MNLRDLVALVDVERNPALDLDGCVDILLAEGWTAEQVRTWLDMTTALLSSALEYAQRARRN